MRLQLLVGSALAIGVAVACSTGFEDDQPEGSFDTLDAGSFEGGQGTCDPRAVFLSAQKITLSKAGVFDGRPTLTRDELAMTWEQAGTLLFASRASATADFAIASAGDYPPGTAPAYAPDGKLLVFSQATADGGVNLFSGLPVVALDALNAPGAQRGASFGGDGAKLYFSSTRKGPFADDEDTDSLFFASLGLDGGYDGPTAFTDETTNSKLAVGFNPTPSADGKTVYFARRLAPGTDHIYVADVGADGVSLTNLARLAAIDTSVFGDDTTNQFPGMISSDNCRLYFASDVTGDSDLYVASRR